MREIQEVPVFQNLCPSVYLDKWRIKKQGTGQTDTNLSAVWELDLKVEFKKAHKSITTVFLKNSEVCLKSTTGGY